MLILRDVEERTEESGGSSGSSSATRATSSGDKEPDGRSHLPWGAMHAIFSDLPNPHRHPGEHLLVEIGRFLVWLACFPATISQHRLRHHLGASGFFFPFTHAS
jgi:hypothetical protein